MIHLRVFIVEGSYLAFFKYFSSNDTKEEYKSSKFLSITYFLSSEKDLAISALSASSFSVSSDDSSESNSGSDSASFSFSITENIKLMISKDLHFR